MTDEESLVKENALHAEITASELRLKSIREKISKLEREEALEERGRYERVEALEWLERGRKLTSALREGK